MRVLFELPAMELDRDRAIREKMARAALEGIARKFDRYELTRSETVRLDGRFFEAYDFAAGEYRRPARSDA